MFRPLHERWFTYQHIPNRWTVSGGTVGPVSVLGPSQKPPPSFQCTVYVSPSCSKTHWVECALPAISVRWAGMEWWLFWFPALTHSLRIGSWEMLPPAGQMESSCWTSACSAPHDSLKPLLHCHTSENASGPADSASCGWLIKVYVWQHPFRTGFVWVWVMNSVFWGWTTIFRD